MPSAKKPLPLQLPPTLLAAMTGILGAVVLVAVVGWLTWPREGNIGGAASAQTHSVEIVGVVRYADGARRGEQGLPVSGGETVNTGEFSLMAGALQMELFGGAAVTIKAPCEVEILSARELVLRRGQVLIKVVENNSEIAVKTPAGELIDLGTEFGISVRDDGTTEAFVFDGVVQLRQPSGGVEVTRIVNKGMGVQFSANGRIVSLGSSEFDAFYNQMPVLGPTRRVQVPYVSEDGFTVRMVKSADQEPGTAGAITSLQLADGLLSGQLENIQDTTTQGVQMVSFEDNTSDPEYYNYVKIFPENQPFPGDEEGVEEDDSNFAVRTTATLVVPDAWQYSFLINTDDGARLMIDGNVLLEDDGVHPPHPSICTVLLGAGEHRLELVTYEAWGFSRIELGIAAGKTNRLNDFQPLTTAAAMSAASGEATSEDEESND